MAPLIMKMEKRIFDYLARLVARCRTINTIWLIGSRANCADWADSDWDFIVFADQDAFNSIRDDASLHEPCIDLLVVTDPSGTFSAPWGKHKSGSLPIWQWVALNEVEATYRSVKWRHDEGTDGEATDSHGDFRIEQAKAIRVWPPVGASG